MVEAYAKPYLAEDLVLFIGTIRREQNPYRSADCFESRVSVDTFRAGVPAQYGTFQILADNRIVGGFYDCSQK
jgi:hypothetical protein